MPWRATLDADTIRRLHARHPGLSLNAIGVAAVRRPEWAEEFEQHGIKLYTHKGEEFVTFRYPTKAEFVGQLIVAAMLDSDEDHLPAEAAATGPGAKSRWRRADLETIFVRQPNTSARQLARSGVLVEEIHHQRISELRARGDIGVDEHGRLKLPDGPDGAKNDGPWVTLPKRSSAVRVAAPVSTR